jgi:diacylglycerol kinase family enzyme
MREEPIGRRTDMKKYCILYNPKAGNGKGASNIEKLCESLGGQVSEQLDVTEITDFAQLFSSHSDEAFVLCGGDGTLNHFANDTADLTLPEEVYYYATGSGNDFLRDIEKSEGELIPLKPYLEDLPICEVNGRSYRFLNGIGYGLDGYCCEVGDLARQKSPGKAINYTTIAIKGLLFLYKPTGATVTVDGKEYRFRKVWIAPTMNGRYFGGGMMAAPGQDRLSPEGELSLCVFHRSGKIHTLMVFPKIFKGEHVKSKITTILTGKNITVEFDEPRPLQVDGETVTGVKKYTVRSVKAAKLAEKAKDAVAELS